MNQVIWGPHAWRVIHTLLALRDWHSHTRDAEYAMFHALAAVLPCPVCRSGFVRNLAELPSLHLSPHERSHPASFGLPYSAFLLHNMVNEKCSKPLFTWGNHNTIVTINLSLFDVMVIPSLFIFLHCVAFAAEVIEVGGHVGAPVAREHVLHFFTAVARTLVACRSTEPCRDSAVRLGNAMLALLDKPTMTLAEIVHLSFRHTPMCKNDLRQTQVMINHLMRSMTSLHV